MHRLCCVLLINGLLYAEWPAPRSAMGAYEYVQQRRSEAERLWKEKDKAGVQLLLDTLQYLEQPLIKDLGAGNAYLRSSNVNLYLSLAEAHLLLGEADQSIAYLQKTAAAISHPGVASFIENYKAFAPIYARQEFKDVLRDLRTYEKYWESDAINTPFRPILSDGEKIAGLSKFWSEVKYNFGFPDKLIAIDWDRLYLEWVPKVMTAGSTLAYYKELMALCSHLGDGHTNLYPPDQLNISAKPPMRTGLVEGRVIVLETPSPSVQQLGIAAGMEIITVDGNPVLKYVHETISPYQSAATPQDRDIRNFGYSLLQGPKEKPVQLTLRDKHEKLHEVTVPRQGYTDVPPRPSLAWKMLPGEIAHVSLNTFGDDKIVQQWNEALPKLTSSKGLILDVRLNGGGSSNIGYEILRSLVNTPFLTSRQVMRDYSPTDRARGLVMSFTDLAADEVSPSGSIYGKPVAVLTSGETYSAAEDFVVAWKNSNRGKTFGEPTGGSTGQPLIISLPGGGKARICTKRDTFPDGRDWVGKGLEPDVLVRPSVESIRSDKDTVLEAAAEYLRSTANAIQPVRP